MTSGVEEWIQDKVEVSCSTPRAPTYLPTHTFQHLIRTASISSIHPPTHLPTHRHQISSYGEGSDASWGGVDTGQSGVFRP